MIASIHQSNYLPGLRLMAKIAQSHVFSWLDSVEVSRGSWQVRNRITTGNGAVWLTVPILGGSRQRIDAVQVNDLVPWRRKHLAAMEQSYCHAPRFSEIFPLMEAFINDRTVTSLSMLNKKLTGIMLAGFGISTRIVDIEPPPETDKNLRLIAMTVAMGADEYISSLGSKAYIDEELWSRHGVRHRYQEFAPKPYPQLHGDFLPDLTALDALFMGVDLEATHE